jgi:hypothetical protein
MLLLVSEWMRGIALGSNFECLAALGVATAQNNCYSVAVSCKEISKPNIVLQIMIETNCNFFFRQVHLCTFVFGQHIK